MHTTLARIRWALVTFKVRLGVAIALAFPAGCATRVEVVPVDKPAFVSKGASFQLTRLWWREDSLNEKVVHRHNLERLMRQDPERALIELEEAVSRCYQAEEVAALIDLTFRYGEKLEHTEPQKSLGLYLAAAATAYHHLIEQNKPSRTDQWDIRICESYNKATEAVVMLLQKLPGGMQTPHGASACGQLFCIEAEPGDLSSSPFYYDEWLPADRWKERGLRSHYWNEGLGARLIATRTNHLTSPLERHQPDEGIFQHATALLVFQSAASHAGAVQPASLVFYNPVFTPEVELSGERWQLAADYTIPWAMLLSHTRPLFKTRWPALMHPAETSRPHRLYIMGPYSADRIPIIMVHGLRSTPLAWQQLTNELIGDPEIRSRYQVWHYLYPTGFPFLTSAADFRDELEQLRLILDPEGCDFAMQNMVVIGHSMGGLLARTLVTDSGDALWNSTFAIPSSEMDSEQVRRLRRVFYFHPKPYVKRAIFVAVPHRGSKIANGLFARVVARRVHLPGELHAFVSNLRASIPNFLKPEAAGLFERGYPNSIRVLSSKSPGLMAMAELPVDPSIPFHSIIGDRGHGDGEKSSDGAVTYASSHLAGANSELIVPSDHRTYENPQALAEVKRILKVHLAELGQRGEAPKQKESSCNQRFQENP